MWFIDEMKKKKQGLVERQQRAERLRSGFQTPLTVPYDSSDAGPKRTVAEPAEDWMRYNKGERYAAVRYRIEPVEGAVVLFENRSQIQAEFRDNPELNRSFSDFLLCVAEGGEGHIKYAYEEDHVVVGSFRIIILELLLHRYDSIAIPYKIVGSQILHRHLSNDDPDWP